MILQYIIVILSNITLYSNAMHTQVHYEPSNLEHIYRDCDNVND